MGEAMTDHGGAASSRTEAGKRAERWLTKTNAIGGWDGLRQWLSAYPDSPELRDQIEALYPASDDSGERHTERCDRIRYPGYGGPIPAEPDPCSCAGPEVLAVLGMTKPEVNPAGREAIEPLLTLVRAAQDMATLNAERAYFVVPESVPQRLRAALDALPADILAAAEKPRPTTHPEEVR
jgi:hypothetical protein